MNQCLVKRNMDSTGIGIPSLQFNPNKHPHATLEAFNDFIEQFELDYNRFPMKAAKLNPGLLINVEWGYFLGKMRLHYKHTENQIIRDFKFRQIAQLSSKTFTAFCSCIEVKTCMFCCYKKAKGPIQDQIVKVQTMKKNAKESCYKTGIIRASSKLDEVQKCSGSYSYHSIKKNNSPKEKDDKKKCYSCGLPFKPNHVKEYKAINSKCLNCNKVGHFARVCCQQKTIKFVKDKSMDGTNSDKRGSKKETYQLSIWKIKLSQNISKFNIPNKHNLKKYLFFNNQVVEILIDTGAKVSVCRMMKAKSWVF